MSICDTDLLDRYILPHHPKAPDKSVGYGKVTEKQLKYINDLSEAFNDHGLQHLLETNFDTSNESNLTFKQADWLIKVMKHVSRARQQYDENSMYAGTRPDDWNIPNH